MITHIHLENFKGIKERQTIELKPITLLYGPNSGGKSTVIQAVQYIREIICNYNIDAYKIETGGEAINLGGFKNFVYKHNTKLPLIIEFELDLSETALEDLEPSVEYTADSEDFVFPVIYACSQHSEKVNIKFEIRWYDLIASALISKYELYVNDDLVGNIELQNITANRKIQYAITKFNFQHEFVSNIVSPEDMDFHAYCVENLKSSIFGDGNDVTIPYSNRPFYPKPNSIFMLDEFYDDDTHTIFSDKYGSAEYNSLRWISTIFDTMFNIYLRYSYDLLNSSLYIGPIREIPDRNFIERKKDTERSWAKGLAAWDQLFSMETDTLDMVNHWLEDELDTGYSIEFEESIIVDSSDPVINLVKQNRLLDESVNLWDKLKTFPTVKRLCLIDNKTGISLEPKDVGVGISQVIPVITSVISKSLLFLLIEQPELHLHPELQLKLADLFIKYCEKTDLGPMGKTIILETHSEHLMLRFLRRIEETSEGEIKEIAQQFYPSLLAVNYFETSDNGIKISQLSVDEKGEFVTPWPDGFFEERAQELFR